MSIFNSDLKAEEISSLLKDVDLSVRFVGILGSGMYPLAKLLCVRGYLVSGFDRNAKEENYVDKCGIKITRIAGNAPFSVDLCVYSLAIDDSDAEILYARSRGIPLISRAQLLGALMSEHRIRISVSGTHGKSTTTALADYILTEAKIAHTAVSGAALSSGESYADYGGDIFLAEACEYKDSFLRLSPTHQIITAVELDHTDYFRDITAIRASFIKAAEMAETVIVNADDPIALDIATLLRDKGKCVLTYGRAGTADYRISQSYTVDTKTLFTIYAPDSEIHLSTNLIGGYNLSNIAAAVALAESLGIALNDIVRAVAGFMPIGRRMELISHVKGVPVYYDYAHHPTEIAAAITALKERYGAVYVIFRPHTYSRTKALLREFSSALSLADRSIILDIYPAREEPIAGIDSIALAEMTENASYAAMSDAARLAAEMARGCIVLLGAGDVEGVKRDLINMNSKNTDKT